MARRTWKARSPAPVRPHRGPDRELARRVPCALCGREARGFGYVHKMLWGRYPNHRSCSKRCLDAGSVLAARNQGMIDKTDIEARTIPHARRNLAEALTELGLMAPFFDRSATDIDRIIEACVDGFQEGMQQQAPERGSLRGRHSVLGAQVVINLNHGSGPHLARPWRGWIHISSATPRLAAKASIGVR